MARELTYKIAFAADNSGASSAAMALQTLGSRSGAAQQAFQGMEMAARGNVSALFGLARAAQALWTVFATAAPIIRVLTLIAIAVSLASKAWADYKGRQKEAADVSAEALEKLTAAHARLHAVIAARREPNYRAQAQAISEIASAYAEAEKAAAKYFDVQDKIAAAQTATQIAGITETEQRAIGKTAGTPTAGADQAVIALNAERERIRIRTEADLAAVDRGTKADQDRIARLKSSLNALAMGDIAEMFSTPLKRAEESIVKIRGEQQKMTSAGKDVTPKSLEKLEEATAARDKLKDESDKVAADRAAKTREQQAELAAAQEQVALAPAKKEQLAAESAAQNSALNAAEANRVAAEDKQAVEKDILKTKEQIRDAAEAETEAVKKTGAARDMQAEDELAILDIAKDKAEGDAEKLRARILSPAAGQAQDQAAREAAREEKRLEKKIASAEEKQKRGITGKWITEALAFKKAREEAAAKKAEINKLEQDRTVYAQETRTSLKNIERTLERNLQLS